MHVMSKKQLLEQMEAGVPMDINAYPGKPEYIPIIEVVLEVLHSEDQWMQGNLHSNDNQKHCLVGAAIVALERMHLVNEQGRPSQSWVGDFQKFAEGRSFRDNHGVSVAYFNDQPETTYEDVVQWVKSLIDHCREV